MMSASVGNSHEFRYTSLLVAEFVRIRSHLNDESRISIDINKLVRRKKHARVTGPGFHFLALGRRACAAQFLGVAPKVVDSFRSLRPCRRPAPGGLMRPGDAALRLRPLGQQ